MKKLLVFFVIAGILAGSLVGARYWAGMRVEKVYRSALAAVPTSSVFRVTSGRYSRGAFSSEARTDVEFLGVPEGPVGFSLVHHITHGPLAPTRLSPFLAVVETTVEPAESSSDVVKDFFSTYPEVVALRDRTVVSLDGVGRSHLELPAFRRALGEKEITVDWQGLTVDSTIDKNWSAYRGNSKLPGLVISAAEGELKVEQVESTFDTRKGSGELFFGDSAISVGSMTLFEAQGEASERFALSGLKLVSSSGEKDGLLSVDLGLGIDALRTGGIAFEKIGLDLRMSNFEMEFIALLKKQVDAMNAAGKSLDPVKQLAEFTELAREHLPSFLSRGPVIEVPRLEIATRDGRFTATMKLSVEGVQELPEDLKDFLGLLVAQAEATVDEALLRQIVVQSMTAKSQAKGEQMEPAQIQAAADMVIGTQLMALVVQGYLRKDNGAFSTSARYQGKQLTINGKALGGKARKGNR